MDYFVRVMHGLGIITVATLTLEAGGDESLQGVGAAQSGMCSLPRWSPGSLESRRSPANAEQAHSCPSPGSERDSRRAAFPGAVICVTVKRSKQKTDQP